VCLQDECYDLELYDWTKVDISDEVRLGYRVWLAEVATTCRPEAVMPLRSR
jgi:hypothetical protein